MGWVENVSREKLIQGLADVPERLIWREHKRIDVVLFTQPRCLIEVKFILNRRELTKAIAHLTERRRGFPGARAFISTDVWEVDRQDAEDRMRRHNVELWTPAAAHAIATESRSLSPADANPPRQGWRPPPQITPEQFARFDDLLRRLQNGAYTTVRRRTTVEQAIQALLAEDREPVRAMVRDLSVHKAAILAPVLRRRPPGWQEMVRNARLLSEEELQAQVSRDLGLKPRGASRPGDRWYRLLRSHLPQDKRSEVFAAFDIGHRETGSKDPFVVLVWLVEQTKAALFKPANGR